MMTDKCHDENSRIIGYIAKEARCFDVWVEQRFLCFVFVEYC